MRAGQAAQVAERKGHAAVAAAQRLRTGEQVAAAVAGQREVGEIEAGDCLAEGDRQRVD